MTLYHSWCHHIIETATATQRQCAHIFSCLNTVSVISLSLSSGTKDSQDSWVCALCCLHRSSHHHPRHDWGTVTNTFFLPFSPHASCSCLLCLHVLTPSHWHFSLNSGAFHPNISQWKHLKKSENINAMPQSMSREYNSSLIWYPVIIWLHILNSNKPSVKGKKRPNICLSSFLLCSVFLSLHYPLSMFVFSLACLFSFAPKVPKWCRKLPVSTG